METKVCSKCGIEKPISEFPMHKSKGKKTVVRGTCKPCTWARQRELRAIKKQKKEKADGRVEKFYEVLENGGYFRGRLPLVGFRTSVKHGCFPEGMVVMRVDTKQKFKIKDRKMVKVKK